MPDDSSRDKIINQTDDKGWSPLHWAAHRHSASMVRVLVQHGAVVDAVNHQGRQALHIVGVKNTTFSRTDSDEEISQLLNPKSTLHQHNGDCYEGAFECLEALIHAGTNLRARDDNNNLPFFLLAATGQVEGCFLCLRAAAAQGLFDGKALKRLPS